MKSLDHRPVHRSYAEALTALPGVAWKPAPNVVLMSPPITSEEACTSATTNSNRTIAHHARQDVAALQDFDTAYDRSGSRGEIPVNLIYVSYSIESGLVSMIGMLHFPTGGPIASLTRF